MMENVEILQATRLGGRLANTQGIPNISGVDSVKMR